MGSCRYYIRIYSNHKLVRTYGGTKKSIFKMVESCFPHIYKMAPKPEQDNQMRDPIIVIMWKYFRARKQRELLWVIRGFEAYECYKPTRIFIPLHPIHFDHDAHRDRSHCFLKLLKKGYKLIDFNTLRELFFSKC